MTRINRIRGVTFTQPNLPTGKGFRDRLLALPNLEAWFCSGLDGSVIRDESGNVIRWLDRSGNGQVLSRDGMAAAYTAPVYQTGYNGRPKVKFVKSNTAPNGLSYSGLRGTGVEGTRKQTVVVIAALTGGGGNDQIFSSLADNTGWNALYLTSSGTSISAVYGNVGAAFYSVTPAGGAAVFGVAKPLVIISSVDDVNNLARVRINGTQNSTFNTPNSNIAVKSQGGFLGASKANSDPVGDSSVRGVNMDMYDLIVLGDDIFATGNEAALKSVQDYAFALYDVTG